MNNAIVYTRISTPKQFVGYSLDIQYKICNDYCKKHDFIIIDYIKEICRATNIKYQKKLITIINTYNNCNLIISDVSRLSRNCNDYNYLLKICNEKNIIIHYIEDNLISSNINDINYINKKIYESENESKILGLRIKKTIQYKKLINNYYPSILKYGYKYDIKNNKKFLKINKTENNIIKLIKNLYNNNNYKKNILLLSKITSKKNILIKRKLNISMIVNFLNYNNILKRNNLWKYNSIYNIIKNF